MASQNVEASRRLAVPDADGVVGAAREHLGPVHIEVTESYGSLVSVELGHSLQSVQGFLMPAFVVDDIWNANTR